MGLLYKPDFIVAGPAKTGTSWLYNQLLHVNGFKLPPLKEISFFDEVYLNYILKPENKNLLSDFELIGYEVTPETANRAIENIKKRRRRHANRAFEAKQYLWGLYYLTIPRNTSTLSFTLYARLFAQQSNVASGDISPLYFSLGPQIIALMAERFPQLKIVFILRNPVEREWSNIKMNYFSGSTKNTFSIQSYIKQHNIGGDYKQAIGNWEKYFDKNRVLYLFYDDLKNDPQKLLDNFIQFVKPDAVADKLVIEVIGKGVEKQIEPPIKIQLLEKNLPQYDFLAEKFGRNSYPAQWKEKALRELGKTV